MHEYYSSIYEKKRSHKPNKPLKCLDWEGLIKFVKKHKDCIECVYAGLEEDWSWTGDEVYHTDFGWVDNMAYTESIWATPIAYIHYKDGCEEVLDVFTDTVEEKK